MFPIPLRHALATTLLACTLLPARSFAQPVAPTPVSSLPLAAAPKKKPKKPDVKTYAFAGEIADYNPTTLTIKGEGDLSDRKYVITPKTQYKGQGSNPYGFKDLHLRKWVGLTLLHTPTGKDEVVIVDFAAKKPAKPLH